MGLKLIKVLGQTFKEQIGVNTALEGMPGKGDYLEMDWDNLNKNDMMVETIGNDVYEWSIIGAGDIGAVKCAWIDEDHEAQRGSPTDIFIEQWEDRNPKRIWTTAQLEICPEIRDYALVMLVQGVAKQ
jgi:hypothetical protein